MVEIKILPLLFTTRSSTLLSVFLCEWQGPMYSSHHLVPPRVPVSKKLESVVEPELKHPLGFGCPKQHFYQCARYLSQEWFLTMLCILVVLQYRLQATCKSLWCPMKWVCGILMNYSSSRIPSVLCFPAVPVTWADTGLTSLHLQWNSLRLRMLRESCLQQQNRVWF